MVSTMKARRSAPTAPSTEVRANPQWTGAQFLGHLADRKPVRHNWRALNVSHAPTWPDSRPCLNHCTR